MKIRLVSDLHIDINRSYDVNLGNNDVYTLIAGDICGTVQHTVDWIRKNVKTGAFCAGNHIVYDSENRHAENKVTIEDIKDVLHRNFPLDSDITFMDYDVGVIQKEICDNVLLVSDVMYTDYRLKIPQLNPRGKIDTNMSFAEPRKFSSCGYMNDFVYGFTRKKMYEKEPWDDGSLRYGTPKGIWPLRAKYYRDHHVKAWKAVTKIVEENPDKEIILMTHHCLSTKCISKDYVNDRMNASYVSDKEKWIAEHPNIRLVLSGHVHHRAHFNVGNALYVLNPLGYCHDTMTQFNEETGKNEMWTPHCFVDTDTWELSYEPYENEEWEKLTKSYNSYLMKYSGIFF